MYLLDNADGSLSRATSGHERVQDIAVFDLWRLGAELVVVFDRLQGLAISEKPQMIHHGVDVSGELVEESIRHCHSRAQNDEHCDLFCW